MSGLFLVRPEVNLTIIGQLIENELISIICQIECRPNYKEIRWFNGTQLINSNNKTSLALLLNRSMHFNEIICQVKNSVGITNQSILLNITCK